MLGKCVELFFTMEIFVSRVIKTFLKRQKWIPGIILMRSCTPVFFSTLFLHHKKMFLKNEKIFSRKFSISGKGLGFFLYNCCIRKIPNPYQNLKKSHFGKFSDFQKIQSRKKKVGLIFGFFF